MVEPRLDGSFRTNSVNGDYALLFARAWSERLEGELAASVEATRSLDAMWRAYDHGDDWIDQFALDKAFRTKWSADATVIWTARHVDRWTAKLAQMTGQPEPVPVPALRTLRNALEHLDEAVFDEDEDDGYATVPPTATRKKFALADLPNGRLLIGTEASAKLYGLIEVDALRELASTLTARLDGLMDEMASDYYAQQIIDERRGK